MIQLQTLISGIAPSRAQKLALGAAVFAFGLSAPAPAQAPELGLLNQIETGSWTIKNRGTPGVVDRICVRNPVQLLQIKHKGLQCSRFVIEDEPKRATVQYSCPGKGNGRTTLRVESSKLVQINTQGIDNNSPFSLAVEGRYTGSCTN